MKIAKLLIPALLGLGLFGCGEPEMVGIYSNPEESNLTIEKSKEDKLFVIQAKIRARGGVYNEEYSYPYIATVYRKGDSLYKISDDSLVGTLEKDQLTLSENGKTYKRKIY